MVSDSVDRRSRSQLGNVKGLAPRSSQPGTRVPPGLVALSVGVSVLIVLFFFGDISRV